MFVDGHAHLLLQLLFQIVDLNKKKKGGGGGDKELRVRNFLRVRQKERKTEEKKR